MTWIHLYLEVGIFAALLAVLFTWLAQRLAPRFGYMDVPGGEGHKQHRRATPVLGGVAMFLAWATVIVGGLVASSTVVGLVGPDVAAYLPGVQTVAPQLAAVLLGALALLLLGFIDDRRALDPLTKFAGQFLAAGAVACWGNVRITAFFQQPLVTWALTTFWILCVVNAINFFDNMDGLAAGITLIAAVIFAFVAGIRHQYFVALLASSVAGVSAGFLVFNHPPATIFMGDAGSHFLGFLLAVIGALTTFYTPEESVLRGPHSPTVAPILIPPLVLALPLFDLGAVVFLRLRKGRPIYRGDHLHISHRFQQLGLSPTLSVLVVHLLAAAAGLGALLLLWLPAVGVVLVFLQILAVLTVVTILHLVAMRKGNEHAES